MKIGSPPLESYEAYRAARQVARLTTGVALVACLLVMIEAGLLIALFPLKEVQPFLVTFKDKGEQVVRIEPIAKDCQGLEALKEALARQYVVLRETFDLQSETERWKQVSLMSSEALAAAFHEHMQQGEWNRRVQDKTTRSVQVLAVTSLAPAAPALLQVEWISEDWHKGQKVGEAHWLSTLTVSLETRAFVGDDHYLNPIGFTVNHYTVARKHGTSTPGR